MSVLFWMLCGLVVYVYVGYPVLLHVFARLQRAPREARGARSDQRLPSVSIVIAARDESRRIPGRLDNLRQLDYPADKQQVIVVSDGSTDETMQVLARIPRVVAVAVPAVAKARPLNAGLARATNEIVVFADMRQAFAPDALRALVAPFRDPRVGAVSGELVLNGESRDRRHDDDRRAADDRRGHDDRRRHGRLSSGQRKGSRRWLSRRVAIS